ncbi:MAG: SpoIIE family protein phosphatase [Cyanobacteria bacterium TGS_CYA1]|nr:SpoIIE family protein phosphatase [Cyanobacteria bacterium TGS_CYA1]
MSGSHRIFSIENSSQAYPVREVATELGKELGFDETKIGAASIVINELAHNLVNHANGGSILIAPLKSAQAQCLDQDIGIEIIAMDRAQGMADIENSMKDGVSTSERKSMGSGLGAVKRLSDKVDSFSFPGQGTAIVSQFFSPGAKRSLNCDIGAVSVPLPSETVCGDGWAVLERGNKLYILVVDGLGHGVDAGAATDIALSVFKKSKSLSAVDLVDDMHLALRKSRGAALSVAIIDTAEGQLTFCGIGNVTGFIDQVNAKKNRLMPAPGTAGYEKRKLKETSFPWLKDSVLIIHTDGLSSKLDLLANLRHKSPSTIAAILLRDYWRGRDDGTVLVIKAEKQN